MIGIINLGTGNIMSVKNALEYLGKSVIISTDPKILKQASRIVLPGVGNFGFVMKQIQNKKLVSYLQDLLFSETPFLGICVGLQVLFQASEESPEIQGLGRFQGNIVKFQAQKIPQIGWNYVQVNSNSKFQSGYAYFVNSYYANPISRQIVEGYAEYSQLCPAIIHKDNITAVQFHPEKSADFGLNFLETWMKC